MFKMFDISFNKNLRFNSNCIKTLEIFNDIIFDFRTITMIFLMNKRYTQHPQTQLQSFLWIDILQLDPNLHNFFLFENSIFCDWLRYACDDNNIDNQENIIQAEKADEKEMNEREKKKCNDRESNV